MWGGEGGVWLHFDLFLFWHHLEQRTAQTPPCATGPLLASHIFELHTWGGESGGHRCVARASGRLRAGRIELELVEGVTGRPVGGARVACRVFE